MISKKTIRKLKRTGTACLSVLFLVLSFLPLAVRAGDTPDEKKEKEWIEKFDGIIEFLKKKRDDLFPFNLGVDLSFQGNRAGESNLYKLNIKTDFSSYQYPGEFYFQAGTALQFSNNVVQEDVTKLIINCNYYLDPWIKVYGFVERFSNSFLSLQHRYEIGGGFMLELNLFKKKKEKEREKKLYRDSVKKHAKPNSEEKKDGVYDIAWLREKFENEELTPYNDASKKLDEVKKEEKIFLKSLEKKFARVSLSLAFTIFSEFEKAEIETYVDDIVTGEDGKIRICEGAATARFPLEGEQRFRAVLRPMARLNLTENFFLLAYIYLKGPLNKPYRTAGRLDYRSDGLLRAEFKVGNPFKWAKNLTIFFEYQRHYDNLPPRLPGSVIYEYYKDNPGKLLRRTIAEDTHEEFQFGINIRF